MDKQTEKTNIYSHPGGNMEFVNEEFVKKNWGGGVDIKADRKWRHVYLSANAGLVIIIIYLLARLKLLNRSVYHDQYKEEFTMHLFYDYYY